MSFTVMAHTLPPNHFLSLPRPGVNHLGVVPDTTTLAAHDFDVDVRTGFMPPQPPLSRLLGQYEPWERILDDATTRRLKLGEREDLIEKDRRVSEDWRERVRLMPTLPTEDLTRSEVMLRRAHHVLTFILHFYVHTLPPAPPSSPIYIPYSLSAPLLQVSAHLVMPPVLTYSDNVLYNWDLSPPQPHFSSSINPAHLRSQTTFTGTSDEEHFYLTSSRIELMGVTALSLLRSMQDEAFVGDLLSLRRISAYLAKLATVIDAMTVILNDVRKACDPTIFYEQIRPWYPGQGSRPWIFEGVDAQPTELSGPSAGQSSLVHVLDIFLGIAQFSHSQVEGGSRPVPSMSSDTLYSSGNGKETSFLERMESYMPRHHRAFLNHLKEHPRPLRNIVTADNPTASAEEREIRRRLREAYNASVTAVKQFRSAHIRIATLYIINPARRTRGRQPAGGKGVSAQGTGGTDLVPFLKGVRDQTAAAVLDEPSGWINVLAHLGVVTYLKGLVS